MVKQFDDKGRMELEDGRTIPLDYQTFSYGYATTAHKSQGRTVDNVIISGNQMSRELFYVSASRGRETVQIFTEDKEWLSTTAGVSGARQSATELAQEAIRAASLHAWYIDFETGAPTRDASRAQPRQVSLERGYTR